MHAVFWFQSLNGFVWLLKRPNILEWNFGGYMHVNLLAANKPSIYCKSCTYHVLVQLAFLPRISRNAALVSTGALLVLLQDWELPSPSKPCQLHQPVSVDMAPLSGTKCRSALSVRLQPGLNTSWNIRLSSLMKMEPHLPVPSARWGYDWCVLAFYINIWFHNKNHMRQFQFIGS